MTGAEFSEVDIDLLADYIGGALSGTPEESAVATRIADDPAWQTAYESLREGMAFVSDELGRFEPEPMPAELAARLDLALSADLEPAPHMTLVHGNLAGGDAPDPVREKAPAPRRGRRLRWVAPIAVAAGVIAFVGFGLDYLAGRSGQSSSDSSAETAAGSAEQKAPSLARPFAPVQLLASGTDYTHGTLADAPPSPLVAPFVSPVPGPDAASEGSPPVRAPKIADSSALQRLISTTALDACLAAIEQANGAGALSVESVDYARFGAAPAVIVRFTAGNGHWAWASGPGCGTPAGDAATLDKVPVG